MNIGVFFLFSSLYLFYEISILDAEYHRLNYITERGEGKMEMERGNRVEKSENTNYSLLSSVAPCE
jgi:hypothetical protein